MNKGFVALLLAIAVLVKEDYRVLGTGSDRSACGDAAAELFNRIYSKLAFPSDKS